MIFESDRKKQRNSAVWWEKVELGVTAHGRREVEVGTLLLGNDNENVIAEKLLSYF